LCGVQTSQESSDFSAQPEDDSHENTRQDNAREWSPIIEALPAPACHTMLLGLHYCLIPFYAQQHFATADSYQVR